jgi:hypothetical protein
MNERRRPSSARRVWSAVVILACAFVVQGSGCDDGDDITIIGGDTLIESLFPGTPISDNNLGNDGQSLSNAELILNQGYVVFRNASNGTAILLYTDRAERLWAHYFNGTGFTPPVEIRGVNQLDFDEDLGQTSEGFGGSESDDEHVTWASYQVLFLNTGGHSNGNAAARNGDALIIWNKEDFDLPSGADPDSDNNYRLYGTYFDASLSGTPVSGDVRFGFDTVATPIDFDNQNPGGDDDDVTAAGFVSDSLVASHHYPVHAGVTAGGEGPTPTNQGNDEIYLEHPTLSGDPTTFAHIVWRKALRDGTSVVSDRYHQVAFDLTSASNDMPAEASLGAGVLPLPGGVTIPDGTSVDSVFKLAGGFVVHNGDMIWRSATTMNTALFLTRFGAGMAPATIELGNTLTSGFLPELPSKNDVYGGDHGGLLALYVVFEAADNLYVAKSDFDAALARETTEIGGIVPGTMGVGDRGTRINRTSDWIMAAWIESTVSVSQVFGRAIQTRGPGDAPRTLANSVSSVVQAPNASATESVQYIALQSEVANGMQLSQCGVQSDRNRINFAFQQRNPADTSNQRLFHNGLVFTADATGSAPPTAVPAVGAGEGLVDEHDTNYDFLGDDMRPVLTDLGTSSGAPVIYYLRNDNNPTDESAMGAFTEIRVFGAPGVTGGIPTLIGTDGALADNTINDPMFDSENPIDELTNANSGWSNFLRVQTAPLNANVGSSPNHSGTLAHVFFQEARGGGNSLWALKSRALVKSAFSASAPAGFGAAHSPAAPTSPPVTLDGHGTNPAWVFPTFYADTGQGGQNGVLGNMFVVQGSTVGVFFQSDGDQGMHFFYQEFDGSSWYTENGDGDAQQIDNQFGGNAFFGHDQMGFAFPSFSNGTCDNRVGTIAIFLRNMPGDDPHVRRMFARVID